MDRCKDIYGHTYAVQMLYQKKHKFHQLNSMRQSIELKKKKKDKISTFSLLLLILRIVPPSCDPKTNSLCLLHTVKVTGYGES